MNRNELLDVRRAVLDALALLETLKRPGETTVGLMDAGKLWRAVPK